MHKSATGWFHNTGYVVSADCELALKLLLIVYTSRADEMCEETWNGWML